MLTCEDITIRKVKKTELKKVSAICMKAFRESVAPTLSDEGIATFTNIASVKSLSSWMNLGNIILVYEKAGVMKGVIGIREQRHLAMLFVDPDYQQQGIGRAMLSASFPYILSEVLTVNASLNAIPAYLKYGFTYSGPESESNGLRCQPMELEFRKYLKR